MIVPDLLRPGLLLVLCGTAPSRASRDAGAYYAHPGNVFWPTLFEVGLIPERLAAADYRRLAAFGIGLTDLNKTEWGADSELSPAGFDVEGFKAKIETVRPRLVAFTSKFTASRYFGRRAVRLGLQPETLAGAELMVLPSTSGRARRYFDLTPWRELARRIDRFR